MARSSTTFKPGDKRAGRKPKSTEVSELKRLLDFASKRGIQETVLDQIATQAEAGEQWALEWWGERFYPAPFVSAKVNEADGAAQGNFIADAFRDAIAAANSLRTSEASATPAPAPEPDA